MLWLFAALALADQDSHRLPDLDEGQLLYQRHCAACHGPTGAGDGPSAAAAVHPPADLRPKLSEDREAVVSVILAGRGAMPGFEQSLERATVRRLLRYLESAQNPLAPPAE